MLFYPVNLHLSPRDPHCTRRVHFLVPAALTLVDNLLMVIAMLSVSASLSGMSRALVPPFTGLLEHHTFGKPFSRAKVLSITLAMIGVLMGAQADR